MAHTHRTIDLYGKPLFSWVVSDNPTETGVQLPSDACFAYILDGIPQTVSERPLVRVEPGQVILSLCGWTVSQMLSKHEPGRLSTIVVHFDREVLQRIYAHEAPPHWQELESHEVHYLVQVAANALVEQYFAGVAHLFEHQEAVSEDLLVIKLREIIVLLLQTNESPHVLQIVRSLFSERTFTFRELVEAHVCEPVTVEQLAMLTNRSVSAFKREFRKVFESTPGEYLIRRRTEKVARQLVVSDEAISQIGYACGFSSPAHLSRAFKARFGMSPSAYREDHSVK